MPLTQRRRPNPDEELPLGHGQSASAQVMVPTRMKLRVRRRDAAAEDAAAAGGEQPEEEERRRQSGRSSSRRKNPGGARPPSAAAAAVSSSPPPAPAPAPSSSSASARAALASEEASPDSKCPICLDRFNNLAFLDRCLHRFCFPCILEWSYNKAECPLCKQPFASILHSVRAEDDFKEHALAAAPTRSNVAATVAMVAAMASAARSDNHRRLMRRRRAGEARRRRRERGAVWEWYLDSLPVPAPLQQSPAAAAASSSSPPPPQPQQDGEADPGERGVIFEGLTGPEAGGQAPQRPAARRLAARLASRRRLQRLQGGASRPPRQSETLALRRALYRGGVRVRGVAGADGERPQRDISAESFRRDQAQLSRLRPWLGRELTVLYGWHGSLIDIVLRIIVARVARHGLEDTPTVAEELRPFLLATTDHFLHELVSFARSPLSMDDYDLQAVYEPPPAVTPDGGDGSSSSSSSSSVIAISEGEEPEEEQERRGAVRTGSCLSLASWDDETPGPSYSTADPSCAFSPAPQEEAAAERGAKAAAEEEGEEECLIVGYKKPMAERTPELVQLSSDSEEAEPKKEEEPTPQRPPPLAFLPTIPPSTSAACGDERRDATPKEATGRRSPSWSGGRDSVCTLSPPTDAERRRRHRRRRLHGKRVDGEAARESSRRRRRKRRQREQRKSAHNPNRSLCPATATHRRRRSRSRSPSESSTDSASDPNWDFCYSQVSPLSSSPSPSSCSSPCSSPPLASPPRPAGESGGGGGEKPGGKRKYKSRHLDDDKDPSWRPGATGAGRHRRGRSSSRRRKERRGRDAHRREENCGRPLRHDRSPSVEIIYEGTVSPGAAPPPAHKRRRRRRRCRLNDAVSSPLIITLDSDSCHDDRRSSSSSSVGGGSSSRLSSQQTVDFCDLPPLPLLPSALDPRVGELPLRILERGSDASEAEPASPEAGGESGEAAAPPSPAPEGPAPEGQSGDTMTFDLPSFCSSFPQPRPLRPHAANTPPPQQLLKWERAPSPSLSPADRPALPPLHRGVGGALVVEGGAGEPPGPAQAFPNVAQTASSEDASTSAGQPPPPPPRLGPAPTLRPPHSHSTADGPSSPLSDSTSPAGAAGLRPPATPTGSGLFSGVDQKRRTSPASSHTDPGGAERQEAARATPPSPARFNHADAVPKVPDNHVSSSSRLAAAAATHWTTHTHTAT